MVDQSVSCPLLLASSNGRSDRRRVLDAYWSRSTDWSSRFAATKSELRRLETTSTTREASGTWTTAPSYAGAILTAVC